MNMMAVRDNDTRKRVAFKVPTGCRLVTSGSVRAGDMKPSFAMAHDRLKKLEPGQKVACDTCWEPVKPEFVGIKVDAYYFVARPKGA